MTNHVEWTFASGCAVAVACVLALGPGAGPGQDAGARPRQQQQKKEGESKADRSARAERILAGWSQESRQAAQLIVAKYGVPDEATASMLVWHDNGPWRHTIAYRDGVAHDFPMPHKDSVEQFVAFRVPPDKFDELAHFDGSIVCERTKGVISARCDKEEMNLLALNLARDIVKGDVSVEEARSDLARAAMDFTRGVKDPYTQDLRIPQDARDTGDPDQAVREEVGN